MIKPKEKLSPIGNACTFINGSPYVECGRCKAPVKLIDGDRQRIVIGMWKDDEKYILKPNKSLNPDHPYSMPVGGDCISGIAVRRMLQTWTKPGCFDCHFLFEKRLAGDKATGHRTFFDIKECAR